MFWIAFVSSNSSDDELQGPYDTLTEAAEDRVASGQVVVDNTGTIVQDDTWLWDWERAAVVDSYAWCMIHGDGKPFVARHTRFGTGWQTYNPIKSPRHYREANR